MALKRVLPTAAKKQLADEIVRFLEAHNSEAEQRHTEYYEKADKIYFKIRDDICKAAESILHKAVLEAKLLDFLHNNDSGNSEELIAPSASNSSENIDIASEAVAAFENLSIPVEKTSSTHLESVQTPLHERVGLENVPPVIHPKIENMRKHHFRAARADEVAFSVDGSPIVALPSDQNDLEARILKQIMEDNDDTFSPNTREVVSTFKNFLRRKAAEAVAHSQELG